MPKFAALATGRENGLAMNFLKSPRLAKKQAAKPAAAKKPAKMQTTQRSNRKLTRKIKPHEPRKKMLERRLETWNKTKNKAPNIAIIRIKEIMKFPMPMVFHANVIFYPPQVCIIIIYFFKYTFNNRDENSSFVIKV